MNIVCAVIQDNQIVVRSGEKSFLRLNGIYRISCIETKLAYYGSTAQSRGFRGRFWDHVYGLRKGTHSSRLMYRDWKRHGESSFVFEILEICEKEKCVEREQFYLDMYGVGINNQSYNTSPSANSCLGVRHSAEVVARQRERMKSPEGVLMGLNWRSCYLPPYNS
jgi:group I intron endonuclease